MDYLCEDLEASGGGQKQFWAHIPPRFPTDYILEPTERTSSVYKARNWPANAVFREMTGWLIGCAAESCTTLREQIGLLCDHFPAIKGAARKLMVLEDKEKGSRIYC